MMQQADLSCGPPLLDREEIAELLQQARAWRAPACQGRRQNLGRSGELPAAAMGSGLELAELRPYQAGDALRHVHWRTLARTGDLWVRQFHQDSQPEICLVIDHGASMWFGTRVRLKAAQAARLAILLAARLRQHNVAFSALILGEARDVWLPPARGQRALQTLIQVLEPSVCFAAESSRDWRHVVSQLTARVREDAHVYFISDFLQVSAAHEPILRGLGLRYRMQGLQVADPAEQALQPVQGLELCWGEQPIARPTPGVDYAGTWQVQQDQRAALFRRCQIPLDVFSTTDALLQVQHCL